MRLEHSMRLSALKPRVSYQRCARALLEHDASTNEVTFSLDDLKPPSPEVAALLREYVEART